LNRLKANGVFTIRPNLREESQPIGGSAQLTVKEIHDDYQHAHYRTVVCGGRRRNRNRRCAKCCRGKHTYL
jgi:hypothetical protein